MIIEKNRAAEFVLSEGNGRISREVVTIAAGAALGAGTVLGIVTNTGDYAAYNAAANDGTEIAAAILWADVDATNTAVEAVVIARQAEVKEDMLVGVDADAVAELAQHNIIVR